MPGNADLVLAGGRVLTMDPDEPEVESLAVRDGRVSARGSAADVLVRAGERTRILDLDGAVALPGFVDAHVHPVDLGVRAGRLDLSEAGTREAAREAVAAAVAEAEPGRWVVAVGWDESTWPSGEPLDREALDAAAPGRPVLAERVDRHVGAANTAALEALGRDPADHPDGRLVEEALFEALAAVHPDGEELVDAVARFSSRAQGAGVTCVHAMVPAEHLEALERARRAGRLGVRVRAYLLAEDLDALPGVRPPPDARLRLQGVKAFADGSIGARTAALTEPYADAPGEDGELLRDPGDLVRVLAEARKRDLQPAVHAIGDRAVAAVLDALEAAGVPPVARPRVEHAELLPEDGLERLRERGAVASVQPNFAGRWGGPGGLYEERLGPERAARADPLRRLREAGVPVAFGSDGMPFGPLRGLAGAVDAPHEAQRLPAADALRAYTRGAAAAAGDAPELGVLQVGSRADVAVLSGDSRTAGARVDDLDVVLTLLDGEVVHDARGGDPEGAGSPAPGSSGPRRDRRA